MMNEINFEATLEKIHSFQKFGSRLGLERMQVLMDLLGNPQDTMKVIHVAGTNGKGSVCRYLATVLQENGYRVGLYTSPYLQRFTERIEYDGHEILEEDVVVCAEEVFLKVEEMISLGYESPTEFELVTAIGFVYFSRQPMDFLVLEVGLGGAGDSTNLIKHPIASVITSISFDHMEQLGDTLEKIAYEKAGIIKEGCPVIFNIHDAKARELVRRISEEKACEYYDVTKIPITDVTTSFDGYGFDMESVGKIKLTMVGMHQVENGVCALTVIEVLKKGGIINIQPEKVREAMGRAIQAGRLEVLQRDPYLILDGAHNEAGVEALSQVIIEHFSGKKLLLVVGMLADKEADRLIAGYGQMKGDMITTEPDNPRRLSAELLCERVLATGRSCKSVGSWQSACDYVEVHKKEYDVIIFSGSLYLIGRVRERLSNEATQSITDL